MPVPRPRPGSFSALAFRGWVGLGAWVGLRACLSLGALAGAVALAGCTSGRAPPGERADAAAAGARPTPAVDSATLRPNPARPGALSAAQLARIEAVRKAFAGVDDSAATKWVDDFERDQDPEAELQAYEAMAQAYAGFCAHHPLSPEARREAYSLLLLSTGASEDQVLQRLALHALTRAEARELLRGVAEAPRPAPGAPQSPATPPLAPTAP